MSLKKPEILSVLHVHYGVPMAQLNATRPILLTKLQDMMRASPFAVRPTLIAEQAALTAVPAEDTEDEESIGEEEGEDA